MVSAVPWEERRERTDAEEEKGAVDARALVGDEGEKEEGLEEGWGRGEGEEGEDQEVSEAWGES